VTAALRRVRGVSYAHVNRTKDEATVIRQVGTASNRQLESAVRNVGYSAKTIPVTSMTLTVDKMVTRREGDKVERALRRVPGVRGAAVNRRNVARVQYDRRRTSRTQIIQAVKRAGFLARDASTTPTRAQPARATPATRPCPTRKTATPARRTTSH